MSSTKCKKCGERRGEGPDPCLGYLSGVAHACCGHGQTNMAYCCGFDNCKPDESITTQGFIRKGYWIKRGKEAIEYMRELKDDTRLARK